MKTTLITLVVLSLVAAVYSTECPHGDLTQCSLTCPDPAFEVGCEHNVCTCVASATKCLEQHDCQAMTCEHDESGHCRDGVCDCMEGH